MGMEQSRSPGNILYNNAYLLLVLTTAFWAGNAVVGRASVGIVSPMILTFCRWTLAATFFTIVAWPHIRRDWPVIRGRMVYFFLMGASGFAGFNIFLYTALVFTTAVNVAIIQAGIPMVIFLLNFMIYQIRTTLMQIIGYTITLVGVILVVTKGNPMTFLDAGFNIGDLIILVGMVLYAFYSVGLKTKPEVHPLTLMAGFTVAAAIISLPFAIFEAAFLDGLWPTSTGGILAVLYAGICAASIAQFTFIRGVELIGSNRAGIFINFLPVFGSFFAVVFLGEAFTLYHLLAMVLVIGGVMLAQRRAEKVESRARL